MTETNEPSKIKALCDKYGLSHHQLGILMGYHGDQVQKVNTGKRKMTARFKILLETVASCLKNGSVKIPKAESHR